MHRVRGTGALWAEVPGHPFVAPEPAPRRSAAAGAGGPGPPEGPPGPNRPPAGCSR
ncbi:hypothetical protein STXM2123_815 [Streptomyces sp. F-3]|nr:hypothetical protein STXM2123_815 [Streptomyces sp. F-3]